jgi:hypothetical protein
VAIPYWISATMVEELFLPSNPVIIVMTRRPIEFQKSKSPTPIDGRWAFKTYWQLLCDKKTTLSRQTLTKRNCITTSS